MRIAEQIPVEIISVDSAQIYRHMDVGTAKPEAWMRERVPHHLIDIIDPTESYSAGRFRAEVATIMTHITERGRTPLLVGGTMLYFNALWRGLNDLPSADEGVRKLIDERARALGWAALHAELSRMDPTTGARINPNDAQRIQRALEIRVLTGRAPSAHFAQPRQRDESHQFLRLALTDTDRPRLHLRIAQRFDAMLAKGLVEELVVLRARFPLTSDSNAMRCVGYRQVWAFLEGQISRETLREQGIAATRQLAKRQITWIRSTPDLIALDPFGDDSIQIAMQSIERALA